MGYSIAQSTHKDLLPFRVPKGMAETDIAARLFDNFRELYSLFTRITQEERKKDVQRTNQHRWARSLNPGDIVYRRLPLGARGPKRQFALPSSGPFVVT